MYQDILNPDGTITRWREGVATTYSTEREARMATKDAPEMLWAGYVRKVQAHMQQVEALTEKASKLWLANSEIAVELEAAALDAPVGESDMLAINMYRLLALHRWFIEANATPISVLLPGVEEPELLTPSQIYNRVA